MILKIKHENEANGDLSWFYVDVLEVKNHTRGIALETEKNYRQWIDGATDVLINFPIWIEGDWKPVSFRWLFCKDKLGKDRTIVFDKEAYLLNDNGKTIERLN